MQQGKIISFAKYHNRKSIRKLEGDVQNNTFAIMEIIETIHDINEMIALLFKTINQKPCGC